MRTKHFLTALCLPLAFAACTNDDFVNESNTLEGREMIDVVLTATKSSYGADTKMSIDDKNQFMWEKDVDMIGAALVDGETAGTVGNDIYINYPFTADADGNVSTFSGKSAMTQGLYFFYYAYQDVLNRKGLPMGKPEQVYDANNEKTALQQAATYMRMVSPIVDLNKGLKYADAQSYNLNLEFANLYTIVQVNIESANIPAGVAPKVTKIKLDGKTTVGGASAFNVNAAIDMTKVYAAGKIDLDDNGQIKTDLQTAALAELEKKIADGTIYSANQADGSTVADKGAFELDVKGDVILDAAKATSLYILVPKGTYKQLDLTVETSEGSYSRTITPAADIVLANKIQPISADLNFAQDGTGNVILPENFDIASADDWTSAIKFMTDHAVGYLNKTASFTLTKDITIESLPIFNLDITASAAKTLTLKKDYTISADNKGQFKFTNVNLAVANGATLTLKAQPTNITTELINYGTLNVSADLTNVIKNFGTLNVTADAKISGGLTNGQLENKLANPAIPAYVGTVNIAKGKALTIETAALANTNGTVAIAEEATLYSKIASTNLKDGKIEVKGILKGDAALVNAGTIDNFGSLQAAITNTNGMFIIEKGSSAKADGSTIENGTVEVKDVAAFATAQADKNHQDIKYDFKTAKVTAKVTNAKEYKAADDAEVTDITLTSGEWTLASAAGADASKTVAAADNATGLTLEGATLNVTVTTLAKNISTSGTATSTVKTTVASTTITGDVVVGEGSTLVVEDKVAVNALSSGNSQTATINGTLNVMPGAKMYFGSANVAEGAKLNVKGDTKTNNAPGEFGVKTTTFNNGGIVTSEAGSGTAKAAGKVSQPVNLGTGTFKGNATDFTFS
ncbi:MAG: hypothetical protein BACD_01027 [Bacteroides rodentium]